MVSEAKVFGLSNLEKKNETNWVGCLTWHKCSTIEELENSEI